MSAVDIDGVTKRYGDVLAVDGVDLAVDRGEVYCLVGPNGSGKTTILNVLLDFVRPTEGSVEVLGHDARTESLAVRERIGVVPEGYGVYDRLTGRQHVAFAADSKGADDDPDAILERVGLADAADQRAGEYSKGMAKRLILGAALVGDPDLLVFDEPFSGLDPAAFARLRDTIEAENDRGTAVFLSTHLFGPVERVGDRVGVLLDGELVAERDVADLTDGGSVQDLFLEYADPGTGGARPGDASAGRNGVPAGDSDGGADPAGDESGDADAEAPT
ncbi:MAG: ABC transporter ATP-binding protein [Haloarculaceae archaeon]